MGACARCDIDDGQNSENVRLNHAGEQAQYLHEDGKDKRDDEQQDGSYFGAAHYVAEESNCHSKGARQFPHDIKRQHKYGGLNIEFQVAEKSPLSDTVKRYGEKDIDGQSRSGGQRSSRRYESGDKHQKITGPDEQKQRGDER